MKKKQFLIVICLIVNLPIWFGISFLVGRLMNLYDISDYTIIFFTSVAIINVLIDLFILRIFKLSFRGLKYAIVSEVLILSIVFMIQMYYWRRQAFV